MTGKVGDLVQPGREDHGSCEHEREVGGVFVIEALSVVIQVASFKMTGQRVFRMAPIHHHFEAIGWSEPKVISRFVIVGIIFALFSLTTLKLR